jgi:hypothetical protein
MATEKRCIYCAAPHTTIEHMPPISMFRGRHRPNGLMFAGCAACNNGTSAADLVASFIARLSPRCDQAGWKIAEAKARAGILEAQAPGFLGEFLDPDRRRTRWLHRPNGISRPITVLDLSGPLTRAYLDVFAAKFGMALYRHHCGHPLPVDGFVMSGAYTNAGWRQTRLGPSCRSCPISPGCGGGGTTAWTISSSTGSIRTAILWWPRWPSFTTACTSAPQPSGLPTRMASFCCRPTTAG